MLVFGDRSQAANPVDIIVGLRERTEAASALTAGLERHSEIVSLLIEGGRLLQGVADAGFRQVGHDREATETATLSAWLRSLAILVCNSWDSGFNADGALPLLPSLTALPDQVDLKVPEGFAFYAVYPEAYAEAARRLQLVAKPRVIGIRSIGTTLGAIVAAALDAEPATTLRPFGDPFARGVEVDPALEAQILDGDPHFVIVDEGPGLSGSSFGAVADWLEARGVPLERIAFLPSHGGQLGPRASEAHRKRWHAAQRQVADIGDRLGTLVPRWAEALLGAAPDDVRDVSAGEWRRTVFEREADWPATIAMFERRKFLLRCGGQRFLLKFAGLGSIGEEKLAIARALYREGLTAEPLGLAHGFLVERWVEGETPLAGQPVERLADYLHARSRLLPADPASGASMAELLTMAERNISLALGDEAASALGRWKSRTDSLQERVRPVRTDNRLDRHEWRVTGDDRLIKTDAFDHHQAHDLVGCQDLAWDVAGAIAEFELDVAASERLLAELDERGSPVDPELLEFCRIAYLALRLGMASMGADLTEDPAEQGRLRASAADYGRQLQLLLQ